MKEEYSRNPSPKLLKDIQEAKKHIPQLQGQLLKSTETTQVPAFTFGPENRKSTDTDLPDIAQQSLYNFFCSTFGDHSRHPNLIKGLSFLCGKPLFCVCMAESFASLVPFKVFLDVSLLHASYIPLNQILEM